MLNALTVDLEDWYHVCGTTDNAEHDKWPEYESRVTRNTERVLALLRRYNSRATFFVLGYIAEKEPALIRAIRAEGHEIAIHGYYHQRLFELTRAAFEDDIKRSIEVVSAITNEPVLGYRAPEWSIRTDTLWALDVLRKHGIMYDSSMVPLTRMGERSFKRFPHEIKTPYGDIWEFPLTTLRVFQENLPFTGGLPLRIAPYWYIVSKIKRINATMNQPGLVYVHPWEFDAEQPRIELTLSRRFMHYFNVRSTEPKFEGLLRQLKFAPVKEILGLGA
ncbi:MAG: polysaccharide deacetylase family protein [Deltaproteobacteria bacterium]|nr:polysaccharide deacetylase family protein [Deltaproteobacteria bacterium]